MEVSDRIEKHGEIWVTKFDQDSAQKFRKAVIDVASMDPMRPIIIYIDSYGGAVDALAKMIETMDEVPNPIVTVCMGTAMSSGAILFSHGDVRFCGRHSRIMIHEVSSGTIGDVHDMHADVKEARRLNEYFMGILARNCGLKDYSELRKIIKEQDGRDRYLTAGEAVEFGIADLVGLPRLSISALYEISSATQKQRIDKKSKNKPAGKKSESKKPRKKSRK